MPTNNINPEILTLLNEFLKTHIYPEILDKDNLLAVIAYGSSLTGYSSKDSDINILVLLNNAPKTIRGAKNFKGKKIEYFIKPIEKFLSESGKLAKTNCPSVALEQNAYFLYDRGGMIANMLQADAKFYNENRTLPKENVNLKLVQLENRISSLYNIYDRNGKEFHMVYYNIVEMLRKLHSKRNAEADITFAKAYRVYTSPEYYDKFVSNKASNTLPDETFVKLYSACVEEYLDKTQMLINLNNLYQYEKQFYSINPNDHEISMQ